jgi:uncharacterized membrane protein YgcG
MLDATVKRISLRDRALCAVFLAGIGFAGFAVPKVTAQAQTDSRERILSFQATVRVQPNSTLDVEETIRVRASGAQVKHGILRDFPTRYADGTGAFHIVGFQVKSVLRDGKPEPYSVGPWQNGQRVKIGRRDVDLAPGEHTFVITYKTDHQLGFFPDHDELYWNVTGFWQFEIEKATAQVGLPEGVPPGKIRVTAYTGPQGNRGTAWVAKVTRSGTAGFATTAPLKPNEGLTIVVGWPKGFVSPPPPGTESALQPPSPSPGPAFELKPGWWKVNVIRDAGGITMASAALGLLFIYLAAWWIVGRDPAGRSVTILYEPPEHLSPAAMRYLRILQADPKTFTSAVLSLASKKYLTIKKEDSGYALTRTGQQPDPKLSADEGAITDRLFTDDEAAKRAKEQYKAQMQDLTALALFVGGLAAMAVPDDDGDTTRLRPSSPRIRGCFQALQDALKASFPPGSIMKTHLGFVLFGALYTVAATIASLYIYPEALAQDHWDGAPLAIIFMVFNIASVMALSDRLAALLPIESFAPARSTGMKVANAIGAVIAAAFAIVTGWVVAMATSLEWAAGFAAMWLGLGMFQRLLKAPTEIGQKFWDEIEGFRRFLSEVDQERLNRMNPPQKTPALFERMLPYAVALDCENAWAKQFENVLAMAAATQGPGATSASLAPAWYSGPRDGIADLTSFTSSLSSSFNNAIASSTEAPGSSSGFGGSSSGGGGGSSGGGGGGGGGGGW